ncbi:BnaCnng56170D [Brassica napus]|uniref:(rape) hypothetical protein n=1 Tax=Brassica napus TaxID=3708 RepID=A0A078JLS1_BRANA|nr:unnamed protein product [Brassica napus]CDY67744.1 BnaCnng56170D [Brassica napus]
MKLIDEHHLQQRPGRSGSAQCLPPDSRVFIDNEVSRPIQYLSWLAVHPNASELVNTSKITKIETLTIGAIVTFINNESVQRQLTMSKEIPGGMANIVDVRMLPGFYNYRFRAEIYVYDSGDKASFVLLGDAGTERTRRQASDLLDNYLGDHHSHQSCLSCAPSTSENDSGQSKPGARCGSPPLSSQ